MVFSLSKNKRLLGLIALVAVLVAGAVWKSRTKKKGEEVYVEQVQKRTIRERVSVSGKIFPETEIKLSADVSGEIVELNIKEGDSVRAGQILGKIRPDEYVSAVERGEAAVRSAEAQREISRSNLGGSDAQIAQMRAERQRIVAQLDAQRSAFARSQELYKTNFISKADLENAESSLKSLEASLAAADAALRAAESSAASAQGNVVVADAGINSARATLKELRTSLAKTNIVAPVSGVISKLSVKKGERVVGTLQMAGTEMMRIANLHSMEVQVEVPENDILKVQLGNSADIEVDAYLGVVFRGVVSEIANSASNVGTSAVLNTDQVTNFLVKVRIDPSSYAHLLQKGARYPFRPGMSASVDIYTYTAENVLSVPVGAVTVLERDEENPSSDEEDGGAPHAQKVGETMSKVQEIVYIVKGDSAVVRNVKTGVQNNNHIELLTGVQEGETVVVGPYSTLTKKIKKGALIKIIEKDKKSKSEEKQD